ncbi:MAG: hypothetical protein IKK43_00750 [Clostridia bacterium]|nr:hypothetical protein [Clostridia bacterium]
MGKKIVIKSLSQEALTYLQENYNIESHKLKELQNKEVALSDEVIGMLEKAKNYGIVEFDECERENTSELENSEVDETDNNEQEMTPERKKYEAEYLKTRAMKMLEHLDVYKDMPIEIQAKIMSAYDKTTDVADIWDDNFLDKRINNQEDNSKVANINALHKMVLGGLAMQDHIQGKQATAEVQMEQSEINATSISEINRINIRMPQVVQDMEPHVKEVAKNDLVKRFKTYIEMATNRGSSIQTLLILGDIKQYAEEIKKDSLNSLDSMDAGSENEAIKLYISQMPIEEMGAMLAAVKDATGSVAVRFDDIDWNDPIERKVAFNLLAMMQEKAKEFGAEEPVINNISVKFEINSETDLKNLPKECEMLKNATEEYEIDINIKAELDVSSKLEENSNGKIAEIAKDILTNNGIELEDVEEKPHLDVIEEITNEDDERQNVVDEISGGASILPEEMAKLMDEIARAIDPEIADPGTTANS